MAAVQEIIQNDMTKFTDWKSARDALRDIRESENRESRTVVSLGTVLTEKYASKLGDEVWSVHEQLVIAAIDTGDIQRAESSLDVLKKRFSKGKRISRLEGLIMEGRKEFDKALEFYDTLVQEDPTNMLINKRIVAIHKAEGNIEMAITKLTEILEMTMADYESWSELADLYITQHQYDKAAFCLEELILSNPHNYLYHQRYAEVCYTQNTIDNLENARKHYLMSLKLNSSNLRSLYGLYQTAIAYNRFTKIRKEEKVKNEDIAQWCTSQLLEVYQENCKLEQVTIVEKFLKTSK